LHGRKRKTLRFGVYSLFENSKDFSFKDQIQRVAVSVMNNIAEGFERKGNKAFTYFLYIAKSTGREVRSMLILAKELNKISEKDFEALFTRTEEISKIIAGFIKSL
jgi:four helix bundle protein